MWEHVSLAFLSAALLASIGLTGRARRITMIEVIASILAAIVLFLAVLESVPPTVFYVAFVMSFSLNVEVCIQQFLAKLQRAKVHRPMSR